jgi:phosphoenolpyruvate carboxylase
MAMAFTTYFEIVNLCEENYRTAKLRTYRAERAAGRREQPVRESIEAALIELKSAGVDAEDLQHMLDRLSIELVLTAHPTESKRRTVLSKLRRLAGLMRADDPPSELEPASAGQRHGAAPILAIKREIAALWLTDRARTVQPAVLDEVRTGMWYFDSTLWHVIPQLHRDLEAALATHYPGVRAPSRWITFGSWIGGDRDGNPNVTTQVTAETLQLQRKIAIDKVHDAVHELSRLLSVSSNRDAISPEARDLIGQIGDASSHVRMIAQRYPYEPYRQLLAGLTEQLSELFKQTEAYGLYPFNIAPTFALSSSLALPLDLTPPTSIAQVKRALDVVTDSLRRGRGALLADGELGALRCRLDAFGLHLARLDLRQHSAWHEPAVAEVLARSRACAGYAALTEAEKTAVLTQQLSQPNSSLLDRVGALSDDTLRVLEPIELTRVAARRYDPGVLGNYVISMTNGLSDVLEVLLMMQWCRADLPIVPLFETREDLRSAPAVLRAMFAHPAYRDYMRAHGGKQTIMLGYSDSNKDCGYVAANWELYKAQETIAAACLEYGVRFTLFHGRGGTVARGGGPAAKAILAQPIGLIDGHIRITEQGEVLSTRYQDPELARRHLEQVAYGVLLATHRARVPARVPPTWVAAMDAIAEYGFEAYRELVHDDADFLTFWAQATPIAEISALKVGSRPAFRRQTRSVGDLRAIPWVFSWMQSRFVLPGWYGLGSALHRMMSHGPDERALLQTMYREWPFFQTTLDNAQESLTKADMGIASLYATLVEDGRVRERVSALIKAEFDRTCEVIMNITGQVALLDNEPTLQRSIRLRNPYVDPLNYIQVEMIRRLRDMKRAAGVAGNPEAEHAWSEQPAVLAIRRVIDLTINGVSAGLRNTG